MRLLTNSRYGTRMMLDIAQHSRLGPVLMRDVARRLDVSQKYLEKISRALKEAGLLVSQRGPNGGHRMGRAPDDISVGDVVRVLEGGAEMVGCGRDEENCSHAPGCLTRMVWKECSRAMFDRLDAITFGELLRYVDQGVKFGDWCPGTVAEHRHVAERELRALAGLAPPGGFKASARTEDVLPRVQEPCAPESYESEAPDGTAGRNAPDDLAAFRDAEGPDMPDGPDTPDGRRVFRRGGAPRSRPVTVS